MLCPKCGAEIFREESHYLCQCGSYPTVLAGKEITEQLLGQLLANGRTGVIDGFTSKAGKPFAAALVLKNDGRVGFEFPNHAYRKERKQKKQKNERRARPEKVRVRVESLDSGTVYLEVPELFEETVGYGLVAARLAECYGCITAVRLVKLAFSGQPLPELTLSLNNLDFARYILGERIPRDKEAQQALAYLHELLSDFPHWQARYEPKKRPKLRGQSQTGKFPHGVFPHVDAEPKLVGDAALIDLAGFGPDVEAQFAASVFKAQETEPGRFKVPVSSLKAVTAWLKAVGDKGRTSVKSGEVDNITER